MASHHPDSFHSKDTALIHSAKFCKKLSDVLKLALHPIAVLSEEDRRQLIQEVIQNLQQVIVNCQQPPPIPTSAFSLFKTTETWRYSDRSKEKWETLAPQERDRYETIHQIRVENYQEYLLENVEAQHYFMLSDHALPTELARIKWNTMSDEEREPFVEMARAKRRML